MTREAAAAFVVVKVHRSIVDASRFVEVDVEPIIALHLQGGLHAGGACRRLAAVGSDGLGHLLVNLAQTRGLPFILLRVVVAGYPPGSVVARHGELAHLFLNREVGEILLIGKLISEAETIIEEAETDVHAAIVLRLTEMHEQFIVMIAYAAFFAPHRCPYLIAGRNLGAKNAEARKEVGPLCHGILSGSGSLPLEIRHLRGVLRFELIT